MIECGYNQTVNLKYDIYSYKGTSPSISQGKFNKAGILIINH